VSLTVTSLSHALGAEIAGVDLRRPQDAETVARIRQALLDNCILLFRDQDITPEQHIAFTANFGALWCPPGLNRYAHPDHPEIFVVSNRRADGSMSELPHTTENWHTDQGFMPQPTTGSLLHCKSTPPAGGDTMFCNLYLAFETLSDTMKNMLRGLRAVHDHARYRALTTMREQLPQDARPASAHPVVCRHPETGRELLFVSAGLTTHFEGMSEEESRPLLDFLCRHATQPAFTYRHRWRVGDILFWDNRCTLHMAPIDYDLADPANHRLLYRTTLESFTPIPA